MNSINIGVEKIYKLARDGNDTASNEAQGQQSFKSVSQKEKHRVKAQCLFVLAGEGSHPKVPAAVNPREQQGGWKPKSALQKVTPMKVR